MGSEDTLTVLEIAEILIRQLGFSKVDKRFIDKFEGRGWNGNVKEYLLDCSIPKAIGRKAQYNSKDAVIRIVREYLEQKKNL